MVGELGRNRAPTPSALVLAALALSATACGARSLSGPVDGNQGTTPTTDASPGTGAAVCCPIETPSCSCFAIGGDVPAGGSCPRLCDAGPWSWQLGTDQNGCPLLVQGIPPTGCLAPRDAGTYVPAPVVVAIIDLSRSTNSPEIDVTVNVDGSATRTVGTSLNDVLNVAPTTWPPHSPEVEAFLADLAAVGDVSAIPTGVCPMSASFGTKTKIVAGGKLSGDLQCLASPSAAATALAHDCQVLLGTAAP